MIETNEIFNTNKAIYKAEQLSGFSSYGRVISNLKKSNSPVSFTGATAPTLSHEYEGLINLPYFFENYNNLTLLTKAATKKELNACYFELIEEGNTYNYSGFLERDLNYFALQSTEDETVIAFFAVHTGLDIRYGYAPYFAVKFENRYDFDEFLTREIGTTEIEINDNNDTYYISIAVSGCSENVQTYVSKNNEWLTDDDGYAPLICDRGSLAEYAKELVPTLSDEAINNIKVAYFNESDY